MAVRVGLPPGLAVLSQQGLLSIDHPLVRVREGARSFTFTARIQKVALFQIIQLCKEDWHAFRNLNIHVNFPTREGTLYIDEDLTSERFANKVVYIRADCFKVTRRIVIDFKSFLSSGLVILDPF